MLLLAVIFPALALDTDTFKPSGTSPDGQGGLQLQAPEISDPNAWYAATELVYAHNPVVREYSNGDRDALVSTSFGMHFLGGYNLLGKVRFDLDLPFYPYVGAPGQDFSGVSFGDIRLGAMIPLLSKKTISLGIYPNLSLPTGELKAYTGAGSVTGGLVVATRIRAGEMVFIDGNAGISGGKTDSLGDFDFGTGLYLGAGLGVDATEKLTVGAELDSVVTLAGGLGVYNQNPVELHAYGSYDVLDNLLVTAGFGTGLVAGVGAPDLRVILGLSFHDPGARDTDKDGFKDPVDSCPTEPEDNDGFNDSDGCPDNDNDNDKIADLSDKCPNDPEDRDGFQDEDGCAEIDNDQDGLKDIEDACPSEAGPMDTVGCPDGDHDHLADNRDRCPTVAGPIEFIGCPDTDADKTPDPDDRCPTVPGPVVTGGCPDRDKDDVEDTRDKCPDEPKDPREEAARSDGCPKRVIVTKDQIKILDMVYFETGKSVIKPISFALLDTVAATLNANPDITLIEVAGHTDNQGKPDANLKLSQARAEAVMRYLVEKGKVDPSRLTAKGYGQNVPIDTNATTAGRANNRRVEFAIRAVNGKPVETPAPTP